MAEYAALPLFTDAYMADTRHLTAAQHGAYLLLLMTAWRMPDCKLPDDDQFLSRCASMDLRTWKANRHAVMSFWRLDDEKKWSQQRLLDERKYVGDMRSKNSVAGKASALKRLNRGSTTVATEPQPNSNPHTHTPLSNDKDKESLPLLVRSDEKSLRAKPKSSYRLTFDYQSGQFSGELEAMSQVWAEAYPAVDIASEILKAKSWMLSNPANKKSNIPRFLANWLARAQDRASNANLPRSAPVTYAEQSRKNTESVIDKMMKEASQ